MQNLDDLAHAIDNASDAGDEASLRQLSEDCENLLRTAKDEDRVRLFYYQSNTYSGIIAAKQKDENYICNWEQPDGVQNVLLLRRAINEPAFKAISPIIACQIRTNLANRLNSLGRPIAANEEWLKVLETNCRFAKALANRAQAIEFYAGTVYDQSHTSILLASARSLFDDTLDLEAFWESGDRDSIAPGLIEQRKRIADYLLRIKYDEEFDLNQWPLGNTEEECSYRRWCLHERLFLNPLNDACTVSVAATDVLHLPNHTYNVEETPRFPGYYNLMKQEYVSARYRLYRALHEDEQEFLMRDVLMLDSGEGQLLGHYTEDLRAAYRACYAIFDKIGLFLNDYFQMGIEAKKVSFRNLWYEKPNSEIPDLRPIFKDNHNWLLRGLFFLSKDLFDDTFKEVSEPDAADLAKLRQQVEHRFLSFQYAKYGESTETHGLISIGDFQDKAIRLMKMAREALIYVSLAMHREEILRTEASKRDGSTIIPSVLPQQIDSFYRF